MATFTRANAWNNGGTFANTDLLWYAKGVGAMQARTLNDPSSWWFFAAIHGEYVTTSGFPGWGLSLHRLPYQPRRNHPRASRINTGISVNTKVGISLHGIVDICWHWKRKSGQL